MLRVVVEAALAAFNGSVLLLEAISEFLMFILGVKMMTVISGLECREQVIAYIK